MAIFHRAWPADELQPKPAGPARGARPAARRAAPRRAIAFRLPAGAEPARAMIWSLEAGGWTEREAGNLVGLVHGLRPAQAGWSEREIEHLRFLRALVASGRIEH